MEKRHCCNQGHTEYLLNHKHFVAKAGMVVQHHKPECHAGKFVHCVQCRGHNEGLYDQNMTISVVASKLLVSLQPNLV